MKDLARALAEIGLTPTEASLYVSCLHQSPSSIQEISRRTKIKRPTVYHVMGTLMEKGLATEQKIRGRSRYAMSGPEHLRSVVERQREVVDRRAKSLDAIIPSLMAQAHERARDDVSVIQYSGIDGMKMVMDIAFHARSRKWDIVAPYKNFLREYDADYAKQYLNARKFHGITSRTLWEGGVRGERRLAPQEIRERNPRVMPTVMHDKFGSMIILFDDKVAIFSSAEKFSALLITSKELHAMFQAMFEGLWETSKPY